MPACRMKQRTCRLTKCCGVWRKSASSAAFVCGSKREESTVYIRISMDPDVVTSGTSGTLPPSPADQSKPGEPLLMLKMCQECSRWPVSIPTNCTCPTTLRTQQAQALKATNKSAFRVANNGPVSMAYYTCFCPAALRHLSCSSL
jgi:hypothetical protein